MTHEQLKTAIYRNFDRIARYIEYNEYNVPYYRGSGMNLSVIGHDGIIVWSNGGLIIERRFPNSDDFCVGNKTGTGYSVYTDTEDEALDIIRAEGEKIRAMRLEAYIHNARIREILDRID